MKSRILTTDRQQNITHRFTAGHDFLMSTSKLTQGGRDVYGNNRELGKHDSSPPR